MPGFEDAAGLDQKLHEISARFLGMAGIDYEADVRPWLGNQLALAAFGGATLAEAPDILLVAAVKDPAVPRPRSGGWQRGAACRRKRPPTGDADQRRSGGQLGTCSATSCWSRTTVPPSRRRWMRRRIAARRWPTTPASTPRCAVCRPTTWLRLVNLAAIARGAGSETAASGYSALGVALIAEPEGLRLAGSAPFNRDAASEDARQGFELASQVATVTDWMPPDTQAAAVVFGLHGILAAAEQGLGDQPSAADIVSALNQLRALAGFGLGINLDEDVLPLLDGETAWRSAACRRERPTASSSCGPPTRQPQPRRWTGCATVCSGLGPQSATGRQGRPTSSA